MRLFYISHMTVVAKIVKLKLVKSFEDVDAHVLFYLVLFKIKTALHQPFSIYLSLVILLHPWCCFLFQFFHDLNRCINKLMTALNIINFVKLVSRNV